jgi:hypothetical protein
VTSIVYQGLTFHPLTPHVLAARSDLDPQRHDVVILQQGGRGWIDFEGRQHHARLIRDVYRQGDALYYWDELGSSLSGSRGIAIVRDGQVIEMFTTVIS